MRLRTTTALGLTAAVLTLPGCSNSPSSSSGQTTSSPAAAAQQKKETGTKLTKPLSSATLGMRLLDETDLGEGYSRKADRTSDHDDMMVISCPALQNLGGGAAADGSLKFPNKAMASFTYASSSLRGGRVAVQRRRGPAGVRQQEDLRGDGRMADVPGGGR